MLLRSLVSRKTPPSPSFGRHNSTDEIVYRFTGPAGGPHTCEVDDEDHAEQLIATGYFAEADGDDEDSDREAARAARAEAVKAYKAAVGKNPSPTWSVDKVRDLTAEALKADPVGPSNPDA